MKAILSYIFTTLLICASALTANAQTETLHYKVNYHWGLIDKTAGRATFTLRNDKNGQSHAEMVARTEPWADHFFMVRDTLLSTFDSKTRLPLSYRRIAHEDGRYASDQLTFSRSGATTSAKCLRLRRGKKDTETSRAESALSAQGDAVDLLSSFYYLRNLDFSKMKSGDTKTINIFSGKRKELLKITYNGPATTKIDGKKRDTLLITFTFTSDQGKTTSKPIKAWLSTEPSHIPLKLVGELKIGKVECIFTGK